MVPTGKRETVTDVLDEEGIDYVLTDEDSGREYTAVVYFPLPTAAVEPVLDRLREVGLDRDAYTVVLEANTVVSDRFEALEERYEEGDEDRIAREEVRSEAAELLPGRATYLLLSTISAVVATSGLLLDAPAVVVGSMVLAPVLGPALATNVGTVIQDDELFREGVRMQLLGFATAMVAATAFAVFVRTAYLVPPGLDVTSIGQVQGRLSPDFLSLAVALGAGAAGALSLSGGVSAALVGVMIAAALVPPMATVGIGVAWGLPEVVVGAGVLVVLNALAVNLATLAVFWLKNYRPERWFDRSDARLDTLHRGAALVLALVIVSAFLVGVTLSSFQAATSDEQIRTEVEAALAEELYAEATLIGLDVHRERDIVGSQLTGVVVTVGRPAGQSYSALAGELNRRIERVVGRDVSVQLQFVEVVEG
jgi:uncharacterized hydrophobic protein (TIGR00341 family)